MEDSTTMNASVSPSNDDVVGMYFAGGVFGSGTQIYLCESLDSQGYWMANVNNPSDRRNISERAIGRTFHLAKDRGDHWWIAYWALRIEKTTGFA